MRIAVKSRNAAIEYCSLAHKAQSVIISISTTYGVYKSEPFISDKNNVIDILRLSFLDADCPNDFDVYGKIAKESDLMSDEQAKQIVDFVEKYSDYVIIVHCDAGISRSSAVAAAILKHYTGDDSRIFDSRWYAPNMWCYYKVLKAFGDFGFIEADGENELNL